MLDQEFVCLANDNADSGPSRERARCKSRGATLEKQRRGLRDLIKVVELEERRAGACRTAKVEAEVKAHRKANIREQDMVSTQMDLPTRAKSSQNTISRASDKQGTGYTDDTVILKEINRPKCSVRSHVTSQNPRSESQQILDLISCIFTLPASILLCVSAVFPSLSSRSSTSTTVTSSPI